MTSSLNIPELEVKKFLQLVLKFAIQDGHSLVAVNDQNEVIGCLIAYDYDFELPEEYDECSDDFNPIFNLLMNLGEAFQNVTAFSSNTYLNMSMIVGEREVAIAMVNHISKIAKDNGFQGILIEATSLKSQDFALSLDFQEKVSIHYKYFKFEGKNVFAGIKEPNECKLFVKYI